MTTWSREVDAPFLPRVSTFPFPVAASLLTLFVLLRTVITVRRLPPRPGIALMMGLARGALQAGAAVERRWHVAR